MIIDHSLGLLEMILLELTSLHVSQFLNSFVPPGVTIIPLTSLISFLKPSSPICPNLWCHLSRVP